MLVPVYLKLGAGADNSLLRFFCLFVCLFVFFQNRSCKGEKRVKLACHPG